MNLENPSDKLKYVDEILPMVLKSYSYLGGFKGKAGEEDIKQELIRLAHTNSVWKMSRRGGKIVSVAISERTPHGLKRKLVASTGRNMRTAKETQGLTDLINFIKDDMRFQRTYAEVSGKMEKLMDKIGAHKIKVKDVEEFLPGKKITPIDEYHYCRLIGGEWVTKMMVGFPSKYKSKLGL